MAWHHFTFAGLLAMAVSGVLAADVVLVGTSASRAVFRVNGVTKIVRPGQNVAPGLRVQALEGSIANLDHAGRRLDLRVGQRVPGSAPAEQAATLQADPQGHFLVTGAINDQAIRFLVDTGATMVSLGASDARRLGLDLERGEDGMAHTAAGTVRVTRFRLERVAVGDIELHGVDALVHENDLPIALLGMSFLNRTDMRREGATMTLKRRY